MTKEATERSAAKFTAHAMRAAAVRLARERAGEEAEPTRAYGCVDWFRYDIPPPEEAATELRPEVPVQSKAGSAAASEH